MEPQTDIEKALAALVAQLREAAGPNLLGVALYGGPAKGRFTPEVSDVNVLIVLADVELERLLAIAPAVTRALLESRAIPFVVTPGDLAVSARLFPAKVLDMQASHRVLWGDVHLDGLAMAPEDLRLRARQEIKNTELRLRAVELTRAPFDYTKWRAALWPDAGVEQLSRDAMRTRDGAEPESR
jgi:predicted nucleotidyltransferase